MMAIRATSTTRPPSLPQPPPVSPPPKTFLIPSKVKTSSHSLSLPVTSLFPLTALFVAPTEARAEILPKEKIVSSLTQVESAISQIGEFGSNFFSSAGQVVGAVTNAVKPAVEVTLPILKQAGEQAVKIASPVVSEASKKAQEAIESTGIDTQPVITAAKTVADAAQQTTKVIGEAKPIATSTVNIISSAEPVVILGTGSALVIAYFLLPPIISAISFNLRGYQGDLSPAQTLDLMSTRNYILIDIRLEKDKNKAGVPRLPSTAKSKLVSIPDLNCKEARKLQKHMECAPCARVYRSLTLHNLAILLLKFKARKIYLVAVYHGRALEAIQWWPMIFAYTFQ